ncbi:bifunctional phosphoserine phosphatase/homoserine phosphotransferase ThrH [Caldilinea sp.]|uniref:bifunctional phosphoserine phosphatase/homoserine phosphotransferase ThrH n=1 Tax=Caldilinea sp. TaxID=2293560 RepID=UPI002CCF4274|nr:bifunctional phosphoserine phosphatase/homoserine phosphotransferase ThrH [Caldilinea sp.]HRA68697.1 bifunctional phosphoserine phosphatase/homoserine phosphotransferase ThrH [Caldilinea sp.]
MSSAPPMLAFDLEGVFLPEIWIAVAERTGLPELRRTTRDEPDYDKLMSERMELLARHHLTLADIQQVIAGMEPLPGASEFLAWMRQAAQMVIITDSFYEFVAPFLPKLGWPTVFAHTLEVDARGMMAGYRLRVPAGKRMAVAAFRTLGFRTAAVGDSYNDTAMLGAADCGILFRPPDNVVRDFPHFPVTQTYTELRCAIERFLAE